jgi:hypothetical protein
VLELGDGPRFARQSRHRFFIGVKTWPHHLDRHFTSQGALARAVHHRHAAAPELTKEVVFLVELGGPARGGAVCSFLDDLIRHLSLGEKAGWRTDTK